MNNTLKARLQAVGWFFLVGFLTGAYDALTGPTVVSWGRTLGLALIAGLGSAVLYLRQAPREPWSYEERFGKAVKDAAAGGVVQDVVEAAVDATQSGAADAAATSKATIDERKP